MKWKFMENEEDVRIAFDEFLFRLEDQMYSSFTRDYEISGDVNSLSVYCESKYLDSDHMPIIELEFVMDEEYKWWSVNPSVSFPQLRWEDMDFADSMEDTVHRVWSNIIKKVSNLGLFKFYPEYYIEDLNEMYTE